MGSNLVFIVLLRTCPREERSTENRTYQGLRLESPQEWIERKAPGFVSLGVNIGVEAEWMPFFPQTTTISTASRGADEILSEFFPDPAHLSPEGEGFLLLLRARVLMKLGKVVVLYMRLIPVCFACRTLGPGMFGKPFPSLLFGCCDDRKGLSALKQNQVQESARSLRRLKNQSLGGPLLNHMKAVS
ncbi:hypothetical protein ACFE04_019599 [Oxalis oulophora]